MIAKSPVVETAEFERASGWQLKPEGACRGAVCIPLPKPAGNAIDLREISKSLAMPLVHDPDAGLWALGPVAGTVLDDPQAPDFSLPDWRGGEVSLGSLRGKKVLVVAWAPW